MELYQPGLKMEVILILCVQKTNYLQIIKNSDLLILNLKSGKSIIHLYCFVYEILITENFVIWQRISMYENSLLFLLEYLVIFGYITTSFSIETSIKLGIPNSFIYVTML